jgi:hypothetical protein
MKPFKPYNIEHINIANVTELPTFPAICYYWWQGIPLGHVWVSKARPMALAEYKVAALDAVRPAIQYYLSAQTTTNPPDWEKYFLNNETALLSKFLSDFLKPSLLNFAAKSQEPLSVVICTRNRAPFLEKCIESLMACNDRNFELIVVDNASDDDSTKNAVARYPFARYVPEPRKGLDIARNTGARNAQYSIVAYTDDDVIVDKEWISKKLF